MILEKIKIENYKSIESLEFEIEEINQSYTYSLLGINESGKSSFLNAISLLGYNSLSYPSDYFNDLLPIKLNLFYSLTDIEIKNIKKELVNSYKFDKVILDSFSLKNIRINYVFNPDVSVKLSNEVYIDFPVVVFPNYTLKANELFLKSTTETDLADFDLCLFFEKNYTDYFLDLVHKTIFWKSSQEYLLLDEIDLTLFAKNPRQVSIPLFHCFLLSGIEESNISNEITKLTSPGSINSLQSKLSELTTKHIKKVWQEHPISITFQINNNKISFLIEDNGVKFMPKTTAQRSDGFKQFISFLLTISAENYNKELNNTILLIDEPETHLHPPAQLNLLEELIKITKNNKNNILFFATHSNYLIDKINLDRNYRVEKENNLTTVIAKVSKRVSTYSEVNYEIFGILNNDYHNELYGYIESEDKTQLDNIPKSKKWIHCKTKYEKEVSLSEYIRHSIHHPENTLNDNFTDKELKKSIELLRIIKEKLIQ